MITKISKIGSDVYSVNDSEIPLNQTSIINLGINLGVEDAEKLMDTLDSKGSVELKTADKGTLINIYEVEYPNSENPKKEMIERIDESNLISQDLFPGTPSEDIVITTEDNVPENEVIKEPVTVDKSGEGRLFTEDELRKKSKESRYMTFDWLENWAKEHPEEIEKVKTRPVLKEASNGKKYISFQKFALFGPDIEIHEFDSDAIKLFKKILRVARGINHNGDYGNVFYKPDEKKIWWVSADGDGDPSEGSDTSDMIKEKFLALDEVKDVVVEAESYPNEEGWIGIKQEIVPVVEEREMKKESWRLLPDADYNSAKEKGWGWEKSNKVEREDVIKVGNLFFRFINSIRSNQLQVGNIYGASYYEYNSGYDIFKFKGFSYTPDASAPEVNSVRELLQVFGVRSIKVLSNADLYLNWKQPEVWRGLSKNKKIKVNEFFREYPKFLKLNYIPDLHMWGDYYNEYDNTWDNDKDYFYLFEGRWTRGSGAEKLTFWEVEEVAPSPERFGWREVLC